MVVMVGMSTVDYYQTIRKTGAGFNAYAATGVGLAVAAGRISYLFGLIGPAVTFDTACSASLVAMHYSVCALRETSSNDAVCAGANLILAPDTTTLFASCGLLAADGRCKVQSPRVLFRKTSERTHTIDFLSAVVHEMTDLCLDSGTGAGPSSEWLCSRRRRRSVLPRGALFCYQGRSRHDLDGQRDQRGWPLERSQCPKWYCADAGDFSR